MAPFDGFKKKDAKEEAQRKQQEIKQTVDSLTNQIGDMQGKLNERNSKITQLQQQLKDTQNRKEEAEATSKELEETQKHVREIEQELERLKAQAAAAPNDQATQQAPAPAAPAPATGGLAIGSNAWVRRAGGMNLRLRNAPGLNSDVIGSLVPGTQLTLMEGPQPQDNYTWWRIRASDGREGWVAGEELVPHPE